MSSSIPDVRLQGFIDRVVSLKKHEDDLKREVGTIYLEASIAGYDKTAMGVRVAAALQIARGFKLYFALFEERGLLKIGVSRDVSLRLVTLEREAKCKAVLLHTCTGTFRDERVAHLCFRDFRDHGEWYRWNPEAEDRLEYLILNGSLALLHTLMSQSPETGEIPNPAPVVSSTGSGAADGAAIAPPSAASIELGEDQGEGGLSPLNKETDDARAAPAAEQSASYTAQSSDPATTSTEPEPEDIGAIPAFMDRRKQQEARM